MRKRGIVDSNNSKENCAVGTRTRWFDKKTRSRSTKESLLSSPSISQWESTTQTPIPILILILNYLDNDSLMEMCVVCKELCEIIRNKASSMENKLTRVFKLSPSKTNRSGDGRTDYWIDGRTLLFLRNMDRYQQNDQQNKLLQGYQRMEVENVDEFSRFISPDELQRMTQNIRMHGIETLDCSLVSQSIFWGATSLLLTLSYILPNIRELDVSNTSMSPTIFQQIIQRWLLLEKVKWNNNRARLSANGWQMKSLENLKELWLDNCLLSIDDSSLEYIGNNRVNDDDVDDDDNDDGEIDEVTEYKAMSTIDAYPDAFLFYKCCKVIERVSLRNSKCIIHQDSDSDRDDDDSYHVGVYEVKIPQNLLIKFIRNSPPTLKYFQSNLNFANLEMLRLEYPEIEFSN